MRVFPWPLFSAATINLGNCTFSITGPPFRKTPRSRPGCPQHQMTVSCFFRPGGCYHDDLRICHRKTPGRSMTAARDSGVIRFATNRAVPFFLKTVSTIRPMLPPLPPMNTWVGAGSPSRASGAVPATISMLDRENCCRFFSSSSRASDPAQWKTRIPEDSLAHSTETEPVPLPRRKPRHFL